MTKKTIPRQYDIYTIHKTAQFQTDINTTYDFLLQGEEENRYRQGYADDWHAAVAS